MTIYIAFLRGINVGGRNKIKMLDLRRVLESIGLVRVETYIQSGNIIFESDEGENLLGTKIEHEIKKNYGFSPVILLRTSFELGQLVENCPFSDEEIATAESLNSEGESLYVSLLAQEPGSETVEYLNAFKSEDDEYRIVNRNVYLLLRHSIRHSKLASNLQKLDMPMTSRNWKTINKLHALIESRVG